MIDRIAARLLAATDGLLKLPLLWPKPAVVTICFRNARGAGIALMVCTLILVWLAPSAVSSVLNSIYPEQSKLLGLVKTQDPQIEIIASRIMAALWIGSGTLILLLFGLAVPGGICAASNKSRALEVEADSHADSTYRVTRYQLALGLTINPDRSEELHDKIRESHSASVDSSGDTTARTMLSNAETNARSGSSDTHSSGGPDRYQITRELGRGTMGVVYAATDPLLDRQVALKKLPAWLSAEESLITRFRQEARALARISHSGIVQVYDLLETAEGLWIVFEMVDGGDLSGLLQTTGPMNESQTVALGIEMAEALGHAHESGVVHRDFKPANVLLTRDQHTKITDFGIAKIAAASDLTHHGTIIGSPRYMSPEQAAGKSVDHRADVYALGVCLYEMCTGTTPFNGDTAEVLAQCITQSPIAPNQRVSNVSDPFNDTVMHMLAKSPEDRIQTMQAASQALLLCTSPKLESGPGSIA